jgi:ribosomal protein S18 acetylase RimI-like enzyme
MGEAVGVIIRTGLPDHLRSDAARLYWRAFGGKLGRVLGPEPRALAWLGRVMRGDHAIVALSAEGVLLGVVGFKSPEGAFAGGGFADLRSVYGGAGALWRAGLLWLLARDLERDRLLMDGICVADGARGRGVGTALLAAICEEGRDRGYCAVRLDVIDSNPRARALYERQGFVPTKTFQMGPLRRVFGFSAATTMVRSLSA